MPIMCNGKMVSLYVTNETEITNIEGFSLNGDEVVVDDNEKIKTIRVKGNYKIIIEDNANVEIELINGSITANNLVGTNIIEDVTILGVKGVHHCEEALSVNSSSEIATMSNTLLDDAVADEESEMLIL
jgi:hypothetical protein